MLYSRRTRCRDRSQAAPLSVLLAMLLMIGWVEDSSCDSPMRLSDLQTCLNDLESDHPASRRIAAERLQQIAVEATSQERASLVAALRRRGLSDSLEIQLSVERLIKEIAWTTHRQMVQRFVQVSKPMVNSNVHLTRKMEHAWHTFSDRAGWDHDAARMFSEAALAAGPGWQWPSVYECRDDRPFTLISYLGCATPQSPRFYSVEGKRLRMLLAANACMTLSPAVSSPAVFLPTTHSQDLVVTRVLGRLVDRTLKENLYGWSIEQRLAIGLAHDRFQAVNQLCRQWLRCETTPPRDRALSLLAAERVSRVTGVDFFTTNDEFPANDKLRASSEGNVSLLELLNDRRMLLGLPGQVMFVNQPIPNEMQQGVHPTDSLFNEPIRTRVQDVAMLVLLERNDEDARAVGMTAVQADPLWGTKLASVGFATEWERSTCLARWRKPGQ